MNTRALGVVAAAGLAVSAAGAAAQQTFFNYTGADFGNWNAAGNWTPFGIPSVANHVPLIPGGKTVRFGTGGPLQITIDKMQIDHGGQVEILNDYDMTILAQTDGSGTIGLLSLSGILFMSAVGNGTDLRLSGPAGSYLTVGGTPGSPNLISMSNSVNNQIYGFNGAERLDLQAGSTIEGAGRIGLNFLQIDNRGSIIAKGSAGLFIDPNAAGLANLGGLLAADTGGLVLLPGPYDNQGTIRSMDSSVFLQGCDITGGTFESTGAGRIQVNTAGASTIVRGVTNNGIMRLPNDTDCYLLGGMTNNGSIEMQAAGNGTDFYFGDNFVFSGGGTIALSNSVNNQFYDITASQQGRTITNAGNTITGSGRIGLNTISITNQAAGSIVAVGSAGLTIDPGNTFINEGTLRAESGSYINCLHGIYTFTAPAVAATGGIVYFSAGTYTGTIDSEGTGVCRMNAAGAAVVFNNLTNLGELDFPNDFDAVFTGTLDNQGLIDMRAAGNGTDIYLASNLLLTGGGTIALSNSPNNQFYDVTGGQQGRTLTNAGNTITGSGRIGLNTISITNQAAGSIVAVGSAGLTIDPGNTFINEGTLRAESGSYLNFVAGSYTFTAPAVAGTGGVVYFSGGTYTGQIDSEGTGLCSMNSTGANTVFHNLTNLGELEFPNDQDAVFTGTLDNQGLIDMRAAGNGTDIYLASNLLLTGGGTIALSNSPNNQFYDVTGGQQGRTLTNAGNTITGSGRIGLNTISIVNNPFGTINASSSSGIAIDAANSFDNQGTLIASGGTITIHPAAFATSGSVTANAGRFIHHAAPGNSWVQTGGTVLANGEIQVDSNSYLLQGGTLGGTGLVDSNVVNSGGEVAPGESPGLLTIEGNYTQQTDGVLTIEVAGEVAGSEFDRLTVTGAAALGGTLRINRQPGYFPVVGTQYTILTCASRTGTFETVEPMDAFSVSYNPTSVVITITSITCIQEYNGDGVLNPDDLGDFITDYYTFPHVAGPGGYAIACPGNEAPYDQGYKAAFTPDGSGQCSEPFPDNLGDYITSYYTGC